MFIYFRYTYIVIETAVVVVELVYFIMDIPERRRGVSQASIVDEEETDICPLHPSTAPITGLLM